MPTLDKNKPHAKLLGDLVDGVRFTQGGFAFSASGECLGETVNGKLKKAASPKTPAKK
jgi:hypothetical protein